MGPPGSSSTPLFASIHASTAVRAVGTAAAIAAAAGLDPVRALTTSPSLLELDMGAWEGADRAACYSPATLEDIDADPTGWAPPGGGESMAAVEARMAAYVASTILPGLSPGGPPAVLVGHGLAIKCLLRRILASDPATFAARNVRLDNTSITEVGLCGRAVLVGAWGGPGSFRRDAWHVLRVNDTAHCEGLVCIAGRSGWGGRGGRVCDRKKRDRKKRERARKPSRPVLHHSRRPRAPRHSHTRRALAPTHPIPPAMSPPSP